MIVKLLTEQNLVCLSLKGGCRGSPESALVKMPHCWKSHDMALIILMECMLYSSKYEAILKFLLLYLVR